MSNHSQLPNSVGLPSLQYYISKYLQTQSNLVLISIFYSYSLLLTICPFLMFTAQDNLSPIAVIICIFVIFPTKFWAFLKESPFLSVKYSKNMELVILVIQELNCFASLLSIQHNDSLNFYTFLFLNRNR